MATHRIIFVIVYDHRNDTLSWQTPSDATRMCAAIPVYEEIGETHDRYAELSQRAGKMPEAYAREV